MSKHKHCAEEATPKKKTTHTCIEAVNHKKSLSPSILIIQNTPYQVISNSKFVRQDP